jgi:hypothetical protein
MQAMDKDDSRRAALKEQYDYLESLKAAVLN